MPLHNATTLPLMQYCIINKYYNDSIEFLELFLEVLKGAFLQKIGYFSFLYYFSYFKYKPVTNIGYGLIYASSFPRCNRSANQHGRYRIQAFIFSLLPAYWRLQTIILE